MSVGNSLLKALSGERHRVEVRRTRVQLLAEALKGEVVEDLGYRGVIHAGGKHLRYHVQHGLDEVERTAHNWRVVRPVLAPSEVDDFLEQAGYRVRSRVDPLHSFAELVKGEVVHQFSLGGGVVRVGDVYLRVSNIAGLDVVRLIVTKWRKVIHVLDRTDFLRLLHNNPQELVRQVEELTGAPQPDKSNAPEEEGGGQ
jgi:hypothetical protein